MAVDLQTFINRAPVTQKIKLEEWEGDIFKLISLNFSYQKIAQYLNENGVKIGRSEIYTFTRRQIRRHLLDEAISEKNKNFPMKLTEKVDRKKVIEVPSSVPLVAPKIQEGGRQEQLVPNAPSAAEVAPAPSVVPNTSERSRKELPEPFDYQKALAHARLTKPT